MSPRSFALLVRRLFLTSTGFGGRFHTVLTLDSTAHNWSIHPGFWDRGRSRRRIRRRDLELASVNCADIGFWILGRLKAFDLLAIFPALRIGSAAHVITAAVALDPLTRLIQAMEGSVGNATLAFIGIFYGFSFSRCSVIQGYTHQKHRQAAASDPASLHHHRHRPLWPWAR